VSGLPPEVARSLHEPVTALRKAAAALECRLDRLSDPGLGERARDEDTEQLYSELEDARHALEAFGDAVLGHDDDELVLHIGCVVKVPQTRWRRHRWGRT
jgi:hypothetical protein